TLELVPPPASMSTLTRLPPHDGVSPAQQHLYTTRPTIGQSRALLLDWVGPGASEETLSLITAGALPLYTVAPFVAMLLVIAVFPLWIPHWWESNRNKLAVSALLGLPILALYAVRRPGALLSL